MKRYLYSNSKGELYSLDEYVPGVYLNKDDYTHYIGSANIHNERELEKYVIEKTEAFKKELDEEVKQMIKDTDQGQVKSIWDLKTKDEEEYYRMYNNGAIVLTAFRSNVDRLFRYMGNAFLTKEEAELERERRKIGAVMRRYSRPFAAGEINYFLACSHNSKATYIDYSWNVDYGIPCFESEEIAQKVIDEIGHDRLKKYWFGVTE